MRLIDADNLNFEGQNYNKSQMKSILDFIQYRNGSGDSEWEKELYKENFKRRDSI